MFLKLANWCRAMKFRVVIFTTLLYHLAHLAWTIRRHLYFQNCVFGLWTISLLIWNHVMAIATWYGIPQKAMETFLCAWTQRWIGMISRPQHTMITCTYQGALCQTLLLYGSSKLKFTTILWHPDVGLCRGNYVHVFVRLDDLMISTLWQYYR